MSHAASADDAALRSFVTAATGIDSRQYPLQRLRDDASECAHYRVGDDPAFVLMVMPQGEPARELPLVNVHRYLSALRVRVPEILSYDGKAGLILLDDLGGVVTFEEALKKNPDAQETLYGAAIDLLAGMRARAEKRRDENCLAFGRALDAARYEKELQRFLEHGLEARCQKTLPAAERSRLDALFHELAEKLAGEPQGFTHRDFHSCNLMVKGQEVVTIGFQDALLGPRQYDLVTLLRDSLIELDRPFVEKMLDRYQAAYERADGEKLERNRFVAVFDLLTLQRKLGDAGRYAFRSQVEKDSSFLPRLELSLRYVRAAFDRLSETAELREILSRYLSELR